MSVSGHGWEHPDREPPRERSWGQRSVLRRPNQPASRPPRRPRAGSRRPSASAPNVQGPHEPSPTAGFGALAQQPYGEEAKPSPPHQVGPTIGEAVPRGARAAATPGAGMRPAAPPGRVGGLQGLQFRYDAIQVVGGHQSQRDGLDLTGRQGRQTRADGLGQRTKALGQLDLKQAGLALTSPFLASFLQALFQAFFQASCKPCCRPSCRPAWRPACRPRSSASWVSSRIKGLIRNTSARSLPRHSIKREW